LRGSARREPRTNERTNDERLLVGAVENRQRVERFARVTDRSAYGATESGADLFPPLVDRLVETAAIGNEKRLDPARFTESVFAVYEGWKEISAALGCSVRTAIRYARESFNPLPVLYGVNEKPFIVRALVRAWLTSRTSSQAPVMKGKRKA
jgi:hypothetical protein